MSHLPLVPHAAARLLSAVRLCLHIIHSLHDTQRDRSPDGKSSTLAACCSVYPLQNRYDEVQLYPLHISWLLPSRLASSCICWCACQTSLCGSHLVLRVSVSMLRPSGTNFRHAFELRTSVINNSHEGWRFILFVRAYSLEAPLWTSP